MRMRGRALGEWTLLAAILLALAALTAWQGWFWRADQLLYDTALSLESRPTPEDVVIVAIDDESLRRIGRWPWPRAVHATLIEKLTQAGTAAVGLDIILSEASSNDPNGDRVLADAIERNGSVVLPVVPRALAPGLLDDGQPIKLFRDQAAALGHIEIQLDADGIARSVYMWGGASQPLHPQFGLALLKVSRGCTVPVPGPSTEAATNAVGEPNANPSAAPAAGPGWHRDVWMHPQFAGPPGTYRTVSYVDLLSGGFDARQLRGKIVLIGATAVGLGDQYPTPMSELGSAMPGVEIHANVIDALRSEKTIQWRSPEQVAAATVMVLGVLLLGLLFLSPRAGLLLSGIVGIGALVGAILALRWGQVWLPPGAILFGAVLAYPLWSWRRLEAAQRFLDAELRELNESEPTGAPVATAEHSVDPMENRIAIVRAAADRQRVIRKARDDTIRFISHDIRSPLASIITLIEGGAGQTDAAARLQLTGHYAQRALNLADDFFRLAKAEAIDIRKFEEVDLASLAQDAADEVWPLSESKHITIQVHDESSRDAVVLGDRAQLSRALINLLGNATKFSPEGSTIRVTSRDAGEWQEIEVADQGCGIAADDIGTLFTRYGRVGKRTQSGIGLGLLIVKTIVERHGGTVSVDSTPEVGSTFRIRLPCAAPRAA